MFYRVLSPLAALLLAAPALAQQTTVRLGLRGGANFATTTTDPNGSYAKAHTFGYTTTKGSLTAWQAGVAADIRRGRLAVQPALLFSQKGEEFAYTAFYLSSGSYYQEQGTSRTNWLELPVDVVFTPFRTFGPQLLAGGYAAVGLGGRRSGTRQLSGSDSPSATYDTPLRYGPDTYNQRFDAGLRLGVGGCLGPVQVQLVYAWGLVNLRQQANPQEFPFHLGSDPNNPSYLFAHDFQADAAYSRTWQLTGTYFFGPRKAR